MDHEDRFHNTVYERLSPKQRENLDALLRPEKSDVENNDQEGVNTFPADENVPLDGVVRGLWREAVMEKDAADRDDRVNRITYEIAVLEH